MIDTGKPPERLDKDTLLNVAIVLSNIKEAAKDSLTSGEITNVPVEFKASHIGKLKITPAMMRNAERSKADVLDYLKFQGAIQQITLSMEVRGYDFLVAVQPDNFQAYYSRVVALTFPYLEELLRLSNQAPRSSQTQQPTISTNSTPLPEVIFRLGKDFAVHKGNIISYKNSEIPLEQQPAKIVAKIMERSDKGEYTPLDYLAANVLHDDTEYKEPEKYVSKMVSEARTTFKKYINTDHNYFPSKRGIGYIFKY